MLEIYGGNMELKEIINFFKVKGIGVSVRTDLEPGCVHLGFTKEGKLLSSEGELLDVKVCTYTHADVIEDIHEDYFNNVTVVLDKVLNRRVKERTKGIDICNNIITRVKTTEDK